MRKGKESQAHPCFLDTVTLVLGQKP